MNKKIVWISCIIMGGISLEIETCSFLRRYGANSYITNIPLFFQKPDPDAPQKKMPQDIIGRSTVNKKADQSIADEIDILKSKIKTAPATSRLPKRTAKKAR